MAKGLRSDSHSITTRQMAAPATGPASDSAGPTGNVPLANVTNADDLKAIEALAGTSGLLAKTAANAWALRTLTGDSEIVVTTGDGAAGNPTLSIGASIARDAEVVAYAQPLDSDLTAIAALTTTSYGRALLTLADAAALGALFTVGSFTPTFTFTTPGTLSVSYASQVGTYIAIGKLVFVGIDIEFTPTLGTASGAARLDGLPFTISATAPFRWALDVITNAVTWPTSTTCVTALPVGSTTQIGFASTGTGATRAAWGTTQFPNAAARRLILSGCFIAT